MGRRVIGGRRTGRCSSGALGQQCQSNRMVGWVTDAKFTRRGRCRRGLGSLAEQGTGWGHPRLGRWYQQLRVIRYGISPGHRSFGHRSNPDINLKSPQQQECQTYQYRDASDGDEGWIYFRLICEFALSHVSLPTHRAAYWGWEHRGNPS